MSEPPAFPWDDALAFALGTLRWSPRAFWAATPRELAAALDGVRGRVRGEPLSRAALDELRRRFPDEDRP